MPLGPETRHDWDKLAHAQNQVIAFCTCAGEAAGKDGTHSVTVSAASTEQPPAATAAAAFESEPTTSNGNFEAAYLVDSDISASEEATGVSASGPPTDTPSAAAMICDTVETRAAHVKGLPLAQPANDTAVAAAALLAASEDIALAERAEVVLEQANATSKEVPEDTKPPIATHARASEVPLLDTSNQALLNAASTAPAVNSQERQAAPPLSGTPQQAGLVVDAILHAVVADLQREEADRCAVNAVVDSVVAEVALAHRRCTSEHSWLAM